jgi:hypothetical protein
MPTIKPSVIWAIGPADTPVETVKEKIAHLDKEVDRAVADAAAVAV